MTNEDLKTAEDLKAVEPLATRIEKVSTPRLKSYVMDLRIHSPESMGYMGIGGLDSAPALVRLARVKGLDVIGVTDYLSGSFVDRVVVAAKGTSITVVPGVVIRCALPVCNDVIFICLFDEVFSGADIEKFLLEIGVPAKAFGNKSYILQTPIEDIIAAVEKRSGIIIPSRMDKTPFRLLALPALVEKFGFRAFDLAYTETTQFFKTRWPKLKFKFLSFSNANALAQIGSRAAKLKLPAPGFGGIREVMSREIAD